MFSWGYARDEVVDAEFFRDRLAVRCASPVSITMRSPKSCIRDGLRRRRLDRIRNRDQAEQPPRGGDKNDSSAFGFKPLRRRDKASIGTPVAVK